MNITNLSTLKIHKLTKEQYERELEAGRIDEDALYLTPDEGADMTISWNDLEDKPFYEEVKEIEIFPECQLSMPENMAAFDLGNIVLELGAKYIVKWNGMEYSVTAMDGSGLMGVPSVMLVNEGADLTTGEGAVFMIICIEGRCAARDITGATELTLSISQKTENIKPLDEKYLPDSVKGGGTFVLRPTAEELQFDGANMMCTTNYDELAKALEVGKYVSIVLPAGTISGEIPAVMMSVLSWVYVDGMGILCYAMMEDTATITFPNGTYVPKI